MIQSITTCAEESHDLYQEFCRTHNIQDSDNHAVVADQLLSSEIQLGGQALVIRAFNLDDEMRRQTSRCWHRFHKLNKNWNIQHPFYYLFMKNLGPIFKGDAKNMVRHCDRMHGIVSASAYRQLDVQLPIFQIPVLYKFDPDLIGGVGLDVKYIDKKAEMDMRYNQFFGSKFAVNNQASLAVLTPLLNDRSVFERWAFGTGNLVVMGQANFIVGDAVDAEKHELIQQFIAGQKAFIIWILPTHDVEDPDHQICILIRKNAQNKVEFVIADSLAKDRRQSDVVMQLYQKYFAAPAQ